MKNTAAAGIILATIILGGCDTEGPKRQTILLSVYKTASGQPCTGDDWQRQYLHGRQPGEEECRDVGSSSETVPVDPRWQQQADHKAICTSLRNTKAADLTPNDWAYLDTCK